MPPLVEIGLTDLTNIWGASGLPGPPVPASLLLQPGGADYAHHITASPPGFENPAASLILDADFLLTRYTIYE